MATYPKVLKPWRGYPSANVIMAIRIHINLAPPAGSVGQVGGLVQNRAKHVGTIPQGAFVLPATKHTVVGFNGTTPRIVIGSREDDDGFSGATDLSAAGFDDLVQGPLMGFLNKETPVFALMTTTGSTTGELDFVLPFYINAE